MGTDIFQGVDDFLNQRTPGLLGACKPWLFCDGSWFVEDDHKYAANSQRIQYLDNGQIRDVDVRKMPPSDVANEQTKQALQKMQQLTPEGECRNADPETNSIDIESLILYRRGMVRLLEH